MYCFPTAALLNKRPLGSSPPLQQLGWKVTGLFLWRPKSARALASSFPPAIVMPTGKRLLSLSQKQQSQKKKLSFSKERGGEWVSCLIHHSGSGGLAPPPGLQQQSKCWITDGAALHLQQGLLGLERGRVSLSPSALRQQAAESAMRVLEITLRAGRYRSVRPWDRAARQEGAVVLQRCGEGWLQCAPLIAWTRVSRKVASVPADANLPQCQDSACRHFIMMSSIIIAFTDPAPVQ